MQIMLSKGFLFKFIVESEESDLILNPINFLHYSWGAPHPSISSPVAGGGNFFGTGFRRRFSAQVCSTVSEPGYCTINKEKIFY